MLELEGTSVIRFLNLTHEKTEAPRGVPKITWLVMAET